MQQDLTTLPARLPSIRTQQGPVAIQRIQARHADVLAEAGVAAGPSVQPWLGKTLCPGSLRHAQQAISQLEQSRKHGFGICYVLHFNNQCLGMGIINYIHPTHKNANLGYWLHPDARGQGLAVALCDKLKQLAFQQMSLTRLELFIEPDNLASISVAKRLNAVKEGLCRKRIFGRDAILYSLTSDD